MVLLLLLMVRVWNDFNGNISAANIHHIRIVNILNLTIEFTGLMMMMNNNILPINIGRIFGANLGRRHTTFVNVIR